MAIRLTQPQARALAHKIRARILEKKSIEEKQIKASPLYEKERKDLRKQYPALDNLYKLQASLDKLEAQTKQVSADNEATYATLRELAYTKGTTIDRYSQSRYMQIDLPTTQEAINLLEQQMLANHFLIGEKTAPSEDELYNELILATIDPTNDIEKFIESTVTKYTTRV